MSNATKKLTKKQAIENIEHSEEAREFFTYKNISTIRNVAVSGYYPVIDRDGTITGWYGADEGDENYVLCNFTNGKIARLGSGSDAVIERENLTSDEIAEIA